MDNQSQHTHTHNHSGGFKEVCSACLGQVEGGKPRRRRSVSGVTFTTVLLLVTFGFTLWRQSHHSQSLWQTYWNAGHRALRDDDPQEAKKEFELAVREAEKFKATDHRRLSSMHKLADVCYYKLHDPASALPLFEKIATTYESILQPDDPELAESYNDLAQAYADDKRFEESEKYYKKAMLVAEKSKPVEEHAALADILKNYANLLEKTNRHTEAEQVMERAKTAP